MPADKRLERRVRLNKMVSPKLSLVLIAGENAIRHFDRVVNGIGQKAELLCAKEGIALRHFQAAFSRVYGELARGFYELDAAFAAQSFVNRHRFVTPSIRGHKAPGFIKMVD